MSTKAKKIITRKQASPTKPRKDENRQEKQDALCGFRARPITEKEIAELGDAYHGF